MPHMVEEKTWTILRELLLKTKSDDGIFVDVGVNPGGSGAFYTEWALNAGIKNVVAVEPFPTDVVRNVCKERGVLLLEVGLFSHNGTIPGIIRGDLATVRPDAYALTIADRQCRKIEMPVIDWATLLARTIIQFQSVKTVGAKIDAEGAEPDIISSLTFEQADPMEFICVEFGGLHPRHSGHAPWDMRRIQKLLNMLFDLYQLGFCSCAVISEASKEGVTVQCRDLDDVIEDPDLVFSPFVCWGNIIVAKNHSPEWLAQAAAQEANYGK